MYETMMAYRRARKAYSPRPPEPIGPPERLGPEPKPSIREVTRPSERRPGRPPRKTAGSPDLSDWILVGVLFLLYRETEDEDFLIMLGVIAVSLMGGR